MWQKIKPYLYSATVKLEAIYLIVKSKLSNIFDIIKSTLISVVTKINMDIIKLLAEILVIFILSFVVIHEFDKWLHKHTPKVAETNAVVAETAPIVKDEPLVQVEVKKPVKVYKNSQKIKAKEKLPKVVVNDNNSKVISSITIPQNNDNPKTVTTVLDVTTGVTTNFVKEESKSWFSVDKRGDIGLYTGVKNGSATLRLQANEDLFDVKQFKVRATANIDESTTAKTDYFLGIGVVYVW